MDLIILAIFYCMIIKAKKKYIDISVYIYGARTLLLF